MLGVPRFSDNLNCKLHCTTLNKGALDSCPYNVYTYICISSSIYIYIFFFKDSRVRQRNIKPTEEQLYYKT